MTGRAVAEGVGPDVSVPALERDPYPAYAWLRANEPVAFVEELGMFLVTRWDDVDRVARDSATFSAAVARSPLTATLGANMLHADGPAHRDVRALAATVVRGTSARARYEAIAEAASTALLDALGRRERADLMADFAQPLAATVMQRMLGLAPEAVDRMVDWFRGLAVGAGNFECEPAKAETGRQASAEIDAAVDDALADAESDTVVGAFRDAGRTGDELRGTVKLFVIGGVQEPRDLLGIVLTALVGAPELVARLRVGRSSAAAAVEEAARWVSPVGTVTREVAVDRVQLGGATLRRGDMVAGVLASANRDEQRWTQPDMFDIDRNEGAHLAFGAGPHTCLGAAMARTITARALQALLTGPLDIELDGEVVLQGYEFRGPVAVPVRIGHRSA